MWQELSFKVPAISLVVCASLAGAGNPAAADIINVPRDAPTIQAGIDIAVDGDEVVVADGVYTGVGNRNLDFGGRSITVRAANGPDNCIIDCKHLGRAFIFQSAETAASHVEGFTICRGAAHLGPFQYRGGAVYCLDSSPTITNCVFKESASGPSVSGLGGAICCAGNSSPAITDCIFLNNWTEFGGGAIACTDTSRPTISGCELTGNQTFYDGPTQGGGGGGVWCGDSSSPTIIGCVITGNLAGLDGGGVCCVSTASVTITDTMIADNQAEQDGGGIACNVVVIALGRKENLGSVPSSISSCTIKSNSAGRNGGGIHIHSDGAAPTVTDSTIDDNAAVHLGGGIHVFDNNPTVADCDLTNNTADFGAGMHNYFADTIITRCQFSGNEAVNDGGGVRNRTCQPTISDSTFLGNLAFQFGGGMSNDEAGSPRIVRCTFAQNLAFGAGGGMFNRFVSNPKINSCQFAGNVAFGDGGGMYLRDSHPVLVNSLLVNNAGNRGGAIYAWDESQPYLTSCTLANNSAMEEGGAIYGSSDSGAIVINSVVWENSPDSIGGPGLTTVLFSDIQGGYEGEGNIDADPMFLDPGASDYRLASGSPCADAGNNWGVPVDANDGDEDGNTCELLPLDLDGDPRFSADEVDFDPGCGVPVVVDMGAYEYQFNAVDEVLFADLDGDGNVGATDLLALLVNWGLCDEECCVADLNIDGSVSASDLLALLANWGSCR